MLIKTMPSRYPIIGRIRLGEKTTTKSGKEAPKKGETLRFTCDDEVTLKALSSQLGGEVKAWENGEQTFQLTSESAFVNVFLPIDPIDTSYERWGSGGCQRRCDGELCTFPQMTTEGGYLEEDDCLCLAEGLTPGDREDIKKGACQVTVRLRLVIPDVPGIGAWLCTSHSKYAAMELPGQVALLDAMRERGQLVPAEFGIEQRSEKKAWEKYKRDYIVPVLRVRASLRQLGAAGGGIVVGEIGPAADGAIEAPALPAPKGAPQTGDATDNQEEEGTGTPAPHPPSGSSGNGGEGDGGVTAPPSPSPRQTPGQRGVQAAMTRAAKALGFDDDKELRDEVLHALLRQCTNGRVSSVRDLVDSKDVNDAMVWLGHLRERRAHFYLNAEGQMVVESGSGDAA